MLPDFPELKAELAKFVQARLRTKTHSKDPVLATIRRFTQHEGHLMRYEQQPDGNIVEEEFEAISANVLTPIEELPNLVGPKLEKKIDELAEIIVSQMARSLFKKIGQSCDKAGTAVDAKGQPMSPELILEMIGKVQMGFDSMGNPTTAFVIHPDMTATVRKTAEQIENDPELKHRHDELLRKQREAWAARESNRKLVD